MRHQWCRTSILLGILSVILLSGCATGGKMAPPNPFEVRLISQATMSTIITTRDIPEDKLLVLRGVFVSGNSILTLALREDLTGFENAQGVFLQNLDTQLLGPYANVVQTVMGIAVLRLRPVIDQGKTDLAAEYLDAVLGGCVQAIDSKLNMT